MSRILLLLLAPLLLSACGEMEDTRPGQPVAHRQQAFKAILRSFEPMGVQLRQDRYEADEFLKYATELDRIKDEPWSYFGADTNYPPTKATDKLWEDMATFEKGRDDFLKAVTALVPAAQTKDVEQVRVAYKAVEESCRNCHKPFKK